MTVRTCDAGGKPGFQSRWPGQPPGPCHAYDEADPESRVFALVRAARDDQAGAEAQVEMPPIG